MTRGPRKPVPGPCARCGRDPAEGFASVWDARTDTERWYCHADVEAPTCFELTGWAEDFGRAEPRPPEPPV